MKKNVVIYGFFGIACIIALLLMIWGNGKKYLYSFTVSNNSKPTKKIEAKPSIIPFSKRTRIDKIASIFLDLKLQNEEVKGNDIYTIKVVDIINPTLDFMVELGPANYKRIIRFPRSASSKILEENKSTEDVARLLKQDMNIRLEIYFADSDLLKDFLTRVDEQESNKERSSQSSVTIPYSNILSITIL